MEDGDVLGDRHLVYGLVELGELDVGGATVRVVELLATR